MVNNFELQQFLTTFLSNRLKPISLEGGGGGGGGSSNPSASSSPLVETQLFKLDRLVFLTFHRLLSQQETHEYKTISQYLPKNKVTIVLPDEELPESNHSRESGGGGGGGDSSEGSLYQQYRQIINQGLVFLQFPYLLDFFAIMGLSNRMICKSLFQNYLYWREDNFNRELLQAMDEVNQVKEILPSCSLPPY